MNAQQWAERGIVVGVDVGGTKTAVLVTDVASGEDLAREVSPTDTAAGPAAMLGQLFDGIGRIIAEAGREASELRAVGVAMPGVIDAEHGRVVIAGNLAGWRDIPLRDIIAHDYGLPAFIDNDANVAALGERWRGAAKQMHNFAFLALGTGVGVGLVINGRLHRGFRNSAGEVGSFIMGRQYLGRDRKGHGNLELLVGGPTIRAEASEATGRRVKRTAQAFTDAGKDAGLEKVAGRAADHIAMTVINIAALLDPEAIILGGGTAAAGESLIDRVRERVDRELPNGPALMRSALGEDAQLHGAVFGALWQLDPDLALREELR